MRFCALLLGIWRIDKTKKEHRPDYVTLYVRKRTDYEPIWALQMTWKIWRGEHCVYAECFKKSFTNSIVIVIEFVKLFLKLPV
jgi:hypothetical protein